MFLGCSVCGAVRPVEERKGRRKPWAAVSFSDIDSGSRERREVLADRAIDVDSIEMQPVSHVFATA
ncbi:hypothetical protein D9M72_542940 [compost metagenome]